MQIAIIGAGFTGLTAAYELSKKGHSVTVLEQKAYVGGLAAGFKKDVNDYPDSWEWDL
ncbi:FAD-dependent oxidoreductase, partial [candidate division WWE3 bacterium]|nr:FAD-dependent oxidoreductase [candidate division WWE3 bacterium]